MATNRDQEQYIPEDCPSCGAANITLFLQMRERGCCIACECGEEGPMCFYARCDTCGSSTGFGAGEDGALREWNRWQQAEDW